MRNALPLLIVALTTANFCALQTQAGQPKAQKKSALFAETDVEKAWKVAATQQKPLLVMFTSKQCFFCEKMLAETYTHPGIEKLLKGRSETVLAHAKDYRELTKKLGIRGYPTTLVISPKGKVLDVMEGFVPPQAFAKRVGPILAGKTPHSVAKSKPESKETKKR